MINQITYIVMKHNLAPSSHSKDVMDWYKWAEKNGDLEVMVRPDGTLIGFVDWIRLKEVPSSREEARMLFNRDGNGGDILFICNAYSDKENPNALMRMHKKILGKNKDASCYVFHNKKRNRMGVYMMSKKEELCLIRKC